MNASLDTDILIHLYKTGKKDIIFSSFNELYIYEYLVEEELKNKAPQVYEEFIKDVDAGLVKIITKDDLREMGIKVLFDEYIADYEYLFDRGEMHAVALAQAMGIIAFVSDDTKDFGPHDTLVRELIKDVIPFAFYELLFLKFINSEITAEKLHKEFDVVSNTLDHPMEFVSRIKRIVRRFSSNGTQRDQTWIKQYCANCNINFSKKMIELRDYLKGIS